MTMNEEWLRVESIDLEAQGVARNSEGKVVFIEGALPGEEVQVKRPVAGDPNKGKTPATAPAPLAPTPAKKSAGARLRHAGVNILPGGAFATVLGTF